MLSTFVNIMFNKFFSFLTNFWKKYPKSGGWITRENYEIRRRGGRHRSISISKLLVWYAFENLNKKPILNQTTNRKNDITHFGGNTTKKLVY